MNPDEVPERWKTRAGKHRNWTENTEDGHTEVWTPPTEDPASWAAIRPVGPRKRKGWRGWDWAFILGLTSVLISVLALVVSVCYALGVFSDFWRAGP